jgi:hypothetical protein
MHENNVAHRSVDRHTRISSIFHLNRSILGIAPVQTSCWTRQTCIQNRFTPSR